MQDFHNITRNFGDIGYNFIVGKVILNKWPFNKL